MALVEMPNGEVIDVDDNISEAALNQIRKQYPATRKSRVAAGQTRKAKPKAEFNNRFIPDFIEQPLNDAQRSIMKGLTFSAGDELVGGLAAATEGTYKAVRDRDVGQIGRVYREVRDNERAMDRRAADRSPVISTVGEITGAVLNPVGTGAGSLQALGRGAQAVGAGRVGGAAVRAGERLAASGAIPQAIAAGGFQGALNAAGAVDNLSDVPSAIGQGAATGALTGGLLGGATQLGSRAVQILSDAAPANAERTAYSRIAQLLENGGTDARKVAREIAVTDARGGDAMVQDMTPGLRAQAGAISRRPGVPSSNELIERGDARIQDRRGRFGNQIRQDANIPAGGDDALARSDALAASRKAQGQVGYGPGGVMDTPITPTPELQMYLREAPEEVQSAMRGAYREMLLRDQAPAEFIGANEVFTHIPNLRTFDYVKRSFDQRIGQALRTGDKATAQGLSYQLDKLKGVLADANPGDDAYRALLASQRDAFQQQNALELGTQVLKRMGSEPRLVLRDLKALSPKAQEEARIGIIDSLINADNKADPVAFYRSLTRNDNQRKIMEFAFGGKGNLGRFERWVKREVRATRADALTAPGRQSETARFAMADDGTENVGNVFSNAMRGFAFGGAVGAASGAMRTLQNIATGTTKVTQEEIARILLSKGENLVKGTEAAAAYQKARQASNRRRARIMGKAGQQVYTGMAGSE